MTPHSDRTARKVLVFVPGMELGAGNTAALVGKLRGEYGSAWDIHVFRHGIKPWSLSHALDHAVEQLALAIASAAGDLTGGGHAVNEVRLVGHSVGGLLLQGAYLRGLGVTGPREASIDHGWATKVQRIVLVGTPNHGFDPHRMPPSMRITYLLASPFWDFTAEAIRAGGYWITNLRILWMETLRTLSTPPFVVQVLGHDDKFVAKLNDSDVLGASDAAAMPNSGWVQMQGADHAGLVDLHTPETATYRWKVLREAFFGNTIKPSPRIPVSDRPVYFIVHGIRASAYEHWIEQLHAEIARDPEQESPHVVKLNYGFFSAYEFALPFSRNRKTHALLAAYAQAARDFNPHNFNFAGHSNGTYMMGRAMQKVPAVKFRHIFLAGSVLPVGFGWSRLFGRRQIGTLGAAGAWEPGKVHNDRAAVDVPVGILATFLHGLRPFHSDIGPGGYRGFSEDALPSAVSDHVLAFPPGHGSALMEHGLGDKPRMEQISTYLRHGIVSCHPQTEPHRLFALLNRLVERAAWFLLVLGLLALALGFAALAAIWGPGWAAAIYAAVLGATYLGLRCI